MTRLDPQESREAYVFNNAAPETDTRFAMLERVFDEGTKRRLLALGLSPGWHCLEVGAGGPSLPLWLSDSVGETGKVVATDIDIRHLKGLTRRNLAVCEHDVTCDPLQPAVFDLVHARLVLAHLPSRRDVLKRLSTTLKPGGWLVIEDFDSATVPPAPGLDPAERPLRIWAALRIVFAARGLDERYGRRVASQMGALGLVDVNAEGIVSRWTGGLPGTEFLRASAIQLKDSLLATGEITVSQLEEEIALLRTPGFVHPSPIMWTTWGRRAT
jgi:ubiquinone/menaquinone biosynthesis C-methylase UbiE